MTPATTPRVGADEVANVVRDTLVAMSLRGEYQREEQDLQPHLQAELDLSLARAFPGADLVTTRSLGGTNKPCIRIHGTTCWPDVVITLGDTRLVAIEVKRVGAKMKFSKPLVETIGQSIIYSALWPRVFAFIVHYGRDLDRDHADDEALARQLSLCNIELIVRRIF
jgi:hypothetical protein